MTYFPKSIGPFSIDSVIGSGSCGQVLKAFDQQLSRWVAIKLLYAFQEQTLDQEAQLLASINHPNVVAVYDVFEDVNLLQTILVMEYLSGNTFNKVLNNEHTLSLKMALEYCIQILNGLSAIHQRGIIHCDLKAENIFLDSHNHLKIGDFGIAQLLKKSTDYPMVGSVCCASPEQILENKLSPSSDLFSLGLLLYRMLVGHHPFDQGDGIEPMLQRLVEEPYPPLPARFDKIRTLLAKLLIKAPSERYQSAQEVLVCIKTLLQADRVSS